MAEIHEEVEELIERRIKQVSSDFERADASGITLTDKEIGQYEGRIHEIIEIARWAGLVDEEEDLPDSSLDGQRR